MTKGTERKVPRVRFKGFGRPWEQKNLGEIYTERNDRGNDSLQILSVSIHSGVSNGELDSETLGKQVRRSEDKSLYKHVYAGDLVLNMMRAWQGAIGVAASEGMVSPAYITAVPNEAIHPPFMDFSLRRSQIVAQMNNLSYGVTDFRKRLYWDSFIRVAVHISSVSEQKKITDYLSRLDDVITLHQQKHDKLVALKQAMLQKMFPHDGATTPEIRFREFEGAWGTRRLGEISDCCSGGTPAVGNNAYYDGDIPFIRSGEINASTTELTITELGLKNSAAKMVHKGDVLYALYGATSGEVGISQIDGAINQAILQIRAHAGLDSMFLAMWLRSKKHSIITTYLQGGQGNLSGSIVKSLEIDLPKIEEQQQIGSYFRSLDELISKHATQIEKLKNIKSACLEKMFV